MVSRESIHSALLVVSFLLPLSAPAALDWEYTGGPEGAVVLCIGTTSAGTVLVGADSGGLYRSDDQGDNWAAVDLDWPCCNFTVPALAAADRAVYAGTWGGGVHRSDDDGLTWYRTGDIPGEGYPIILALAVCRFGETVYAGGQFGVARSDDGGAEWYLVNDGLPGDWVRTLALRGTVLYARLDQGIYRLDPDSRTWSVWEEGLGTTFAMQSISATADALFLATHEGGVYRLDCDDAGWVPMNGGLFDDNVDAVQEVDRTLYAGLMGGGVWRWNPAESWWTEVNDGLWNRDVRVMGRIGLFPLAGTWGAGVFRFEPDPGEWTCRSSGMLSPLVTTLVADGGDVYCGLEGGGVFKSEDQGDTWFQASGGLDNMWVMKMACDAGGVYAGTWNGVWKSDDGGQSWAASGLQGEGVMALETLDAVLYAGLYNGAVLASGDGGQSWQPVGSGLSGGAVAGLARLGSTLFAALEGQGVFILPDGEPTWSQANAGLGDPEPSCLTAHGGSVFLGTAAGGVYRWNPGTEEWVAMGLGGNLVFFLTGAGGWLFAATYGGLWASADGGETWASEHSGLKEWLPVRAVCEGPDNIFAGLGGGGVYRTANLSAVPDGPGQELVPDPETSLRVGPNPCAGGTLVAFDLASRQEVELAVYDVAGRRVATLAAGTFEAGTHRREWAGRSDSGDPAAAGVYIVRMRSGGVERTAKTIHVR